MPVGGEAASAIRVAVTSADGSTPVGGATVQWSASDGATLTASKGASNCFVCSDESGKLETRVDVGTIEGSTITATLAPASYSPAKSEQATVSGTSTATDLAIFTPKVRVAKGTTVDVPLTARLLSNGVPVSGSTINFQGAARFWRCHIAQRRHGCNRACTVHAARFQAEFGCSRLGMCGAGE